MGTGATRICRWASCLMPAQARLASHPAVAMATVSG